MEKRNNQKQSGVGIRFRLPLLVGIATLLLAGGAITVLSLQNTAIAKTTPTSSKTQIANDKKYITVKVAGRDVQVDPQTGQMKPLTPEEAQRLADGLRGMLNKSSEGLVLEQHADGSASMDLQGRFQNVTVARVESDGTLTQSCIDRPEQAASFFGIDPALLGVRPKDGAIQQSLRITPAKKSRR